MIKICETKKDACCLQRALPVLASGFQTLLYVMGLGLYACFKVLILLLLLLFLSHPATLQTLI